MSATLVSRSLPCRKLHLHGGGRERKCDACVSLLVVWHKRHSSLRHTFTPVNERLCSCIRMRCRKVPVYDSTALPHQLPSSPSTLRCAENGTPEHWNTARVFMCCVMWPLRVMWRVGVEAPTHISLFDLSCFALNDRLTPREEAT